MKRPTWKYLTLICFLTVVLPVSLGPTTAWLAGAANVGRSVVICTGLAIALSALRIWVEIFCWRRHCRRWDLDPKTGEPVRRNLAVSGGKVLNETVKYIQQRYRDANA